MPSSIQIPLKKRSSITGAYRAIKALEEMMFKMNKKQRFIHQVRWMRAELILMLRNSGYAYISGRYRITKLEECKDIVLLKNEKRKR